MTRADLLNPLDAASPVTAMVAGPGDRTTTKVVAIKSASVCNGIIRSSLDGYERRTKSMVQFVSHVLPASGENACSQCSVSGVVAVHVKRTQIGRPLKLSSA